MRAGIAIALMGVVWLGTSAGTAAAQQHGAAGPAIEVESIRALLLQGLEQGKAMDIDFARAIPDSALRWAPTPEVRDFAEQVEHTAVDNALFVALGILNVPMPSFGDTAVYLNDKEALVGAVTAAYDWVEQSLRDLPAEEFMVETSLFGQKLPKWRVYLQALEHGYWTRGQLVPYFRMNGMAPPRYRAF
ncbi:MAG: DinB family protein [Gemmatimonadales bacterium]|nr:MAG: DinB family protein [Gemmatimonadales bacterium]